MTAVETGRQTRSLVARNLLQVRAGRRLVDDVSLTVDPGQMVALFGPSGSGKTTLLTILGGVTKPDSGTVTFDDGPVEAGKSHDLSVVLQGYGLIPILTAAENVEVALQARGVEPAEVRERAAETLTRVQLVGVGDRLVERLSGGQQQRVAIARALVVRPRLLLADEPTSELDEVTRDAIVTELRQEASSGAVVVLATHDPDVMARCDRTMQIVDGRLVEKSWDDPLRGARQL
jgi:putative ABC transport system ATP-binding protein